MSMAAPFPWFNPDASPMPGLPVYPPMFPGQLYPPQPFPGFNLHAGYPSVLATAQTPGATHQFSNVEGLAQSSQTPTHAAPDTENEHRAIPTERPLKSPPSTTAGGSDVRTPERPRGGCDRVDRDSRTVDGDSPRSPDSSSAGPDPGARLPTAASKYPDYCKTITIKDASGHVKELVFPKALDLDRPKRARTTFSPEQLLTLEHEFQLNQYLVGRERTDLARRLGLSETQVKVWFQNRRTKYKRDKSREAEVECARAESSAACNIYRILQGGNHGDTHQTHASSEPNMAGSVPMTTNPPYLHSPKDSSVPNPANGLLQTASPGFLPYNR